MSSASTNRVARAEVSTPSQEVPGPPIVPGREMPVSVLKPTDHLGRQIEFLLWENPAVTQSLQNPDLSSMTVMEKEHLLRELRSILGIKPIPRRHLGYVGP